MENGREEILTDIEALGKDQNLSRGEEFHLRTQAMDDIEFHITEWSHAMNNGGDLPETIHKSIQRAEKVKHRLEAINTKMFEKLRNEISQGKHRGEGLIQLVNKHIDQYFDDFPESGIAGYDHLDIFINGLLSYRDMPAETKDLEPEMVFYQKTPARIIFELIKRTAFQPGDVFLDLGSGLGQVTMLVNLLTSVKSIGIEYEPAYCSYARARAASLNLYHVDFINEDARYADYSAGTIFFMYTPFSGEMLRDVLCKLDIEAGKRKIRIFTFGSCTTEIAQQHWLRQAYEIKNCTVEPAEFASV